jgi:hypothetical protein
MILTRKFGSSKTLDAFLHDPSTHEMWDVIAVDFVYCTARLETKDSLE